MTEKQQAELEAPTKLQILWRKSIPYHFVLIPLAFYLYFFFIPAIQSFYLGFFDWNGFAPTKTFIGIRNYIDILTKDRLFVRAISNNIYWTIGSIVLPLTLGLVLAVVFSSKRLAGRNFFRTSIFMPYVLSTIVVAMLWGQIYNPQSGIINKLIEMVTGKASHIAFLGSPKMALISVLLAATWQAVGFYMVVFYAGLQTIPEELYEVAAIEGANPIQSFFYITLPMIREIMTVMVVITIIGSFKVFDIIYTMTKGGPLYATEVTATRMISEAFSHNRFGYAAAYSCLMFFIIAILSFIYLRLNRRRVGE